MTTKGTLAPTPEYMEALGRAEEKYGKRQAINHVRDEMYAMRINGDSVCAGLEDVDDKHRAVATKYPHLYRYVHD